MIHYITCHFGTDELIDIQLQHIKQFTDTDYKVWMSYTTPSKEEKWDRTWFHEKILDNHTDIIAVNKDKCHHFEFIPITQTPTSERFTIHDLSDGRRFVGSQNHQNNLHILTDRVLNSKDTQDTDILVWLDSDAMLIDSSINDIIRNSAQMFTAVQRNDRVDPYGINLLFPHPSFACCSVKFFNHHNLNWLGGHLYRGSNNKRMFTDTGGFLYEYFEHRGIDWYKLHKTRSLNNDLRFEIYDDKILHITNAQLSNTRRRLFAETQQDEEYVKIYDSILAGKYLNGI